MNAILRVTAFIDWDTARRLVPHDPRIGRKRLVDREIYCLQDQIAMVLTQRSRTSHFRVSLRLYHGWYSGKTKTDDRKDLDAFCKKNRNQRVLNNVSFAPELFFGDELLCGGHRCAIYDTFRSRDGKDKPEQKMVDTSLISDILHYGHTQKKSPIIVVGDDDDLLPGVFTADSWGCQVLLCRLRNEDNKHLNTDGLVSRLRKSS